MESPIITLNGSRLYLAEGQALTIVRDNGETHVLIDDADEALREEDAAVSSQKLAEVITAFTAPNPIMQDIAFKSMVKDTPTPRDADPKKWVIRAALDYLRAHLTDTDVADILQTLRAHGSVVIGAPLTNADLPEEFA